MFHGVFREVLNVLDPNLKIHSIPHYLTTILLLVGVIQEELNCRLLSESLNVICDSIVLQNAYDIVLTRLVLFIKLFVRRQDKEFKRICAYLYLCL